MSDNASLNGSSQPTEDRLDVLGSLLRLVIGGMLVGVDELHFRLQVWDKAARSVTREASPTLTRSSEPPAPWPYALIGALFDSETRMRQGFSRARARLERFAYDVDTSVDDIVESYYDDLAESRLPQTLLDPLLARLDELLLDTEERVDRWAERGKREAEQGSRMARLASSGVVDELLDYMARNPEVRQMIEQQASGMADVAVSEVRGRTQTADLWIERLAHRALRRPTGGEAPPEKVSAAEAPHSAAETQSAMPSATTQPIAPTTSAPAVHTAADARNARRHDTGG